MSGLPVWVRTPANLGHVGRAAGVGEARPFRGGKLCVTLFSDDQVIYRAMAITVLGAGKIAVRCVDFWNQEEKFVS